MNVLQVLLRAWIVTLFALSLIGVLTLSRIQTRLLKAHGWHVFREKALLQLYWRELSPSQRWLLWPGIVMLLLTLAAPLY